METLLTRIDYEEIDFEVYESQQFATVLFDREEDADTTLITVIKDKKVKQFEGDNKYNPSKRRHSSCVYVREEQDPTTVIKICTIQHKGETLLEIHKVPKEELSFLFNM